MATIDPTDAFGMRREICWEVTFRENDAVRILEGEMTGEVGTVISLITRDPQPVYIVETCCGRDIMVQESEIELLLQTIEAPVTGDRSRLAQVTANLLSNALKFTPRGGVVKVTVATTDSLAILEVADSGHGIDPEFLPKVFERFSQARTHSAQGLGLGLSIVQEIVRHHNGVVRAASDGLGKGARFIVELPLRQTRG